MPKPTLASPLDGGVPLSTEEPAALVAFLKTLTEENFVTKRKQAESSSFVKVGRGKVDL